MESTLQIEDKLKFIEVIYLGFANNYHNAIVNHNEYYSHLVILPGRNPQGLCIGL